MSYRFDGVLRSSDPRAPEFMIEIKSYIHADGIRNGLNSLQQVSLGAAWADFNSQILHIPMLIVVTTDVRGRQMEQVSEFLLKSAENPTAIGRSLVRLVAPSRLKTLSAKDVQSILDSSQRLVILSNADHQ